MKRLISVFFLSFAAAGMSAEIDKDIATLRGVSAKGAGSVAAAKAWSRLSKADAAELPKILAGMKGAGPVAMNYFRSLADAIADRQLQRLPLKELEAFIGDRKHEPKARRTAYEIVRRVDATAERRLIPSLFNDPSLELRRDAIAMMLKKAESTEKRDQVAAVKIFSKALSNARDLDQIDAASKKLETLGRRVDLPKHFGFLMTWQLLAPFDNTEKSGFDVTYPPEKRIDLTATYKGKEDAAVRWTSHTTSDKYGTVDLNKALGKHKGAIAYAHAVFVSPRDQQVDIRLGCINGNKVWVNGRQITSNHVYHANTKIDQYVGRARIRKGPNQILVKVAQNEQTEDWAQRWEFQLRVCDQFGTAILSADRK